MLIPSEQYEDARAALEAAVADGVFIRAAVAFVTCSGVAEIASILSSVQGAAIEITARAADVTEPEALLALRDDLGADVSVVIGRHARAFHPKLWLLDRPDKTVVISGSGNLTHGGLCSNDEQFEVFEFEPGDVTIAAHHDRYETLTRNAHPLDAIEGAAIWLEWLNVRRQQAQARRALAHAERNLNQREPIADRSLDKAKLVNDLQQIYDDTVAADLPRADGERYYPTRLLVAIYAARDGNREPVKVVSDTIRRHTDGLDILLEAGRVDLTLEWLVLDESKPYHDLFSRASVKLASDRIEEFRRAGHEIPAVGAPRQQVTDVMTNAEIEAFLRSLVLDKPGGYALPVLHRAQATLLRVEAGHAKVRRDVGTPARIPIRLLRSRLTQLAGGGRLAVSELRENPSDRFNSAMGPLMAVLPGVAFDGHDKRLYYDERADVEPA